MRGQFNSEPYDLPGWLVFDSRFELGLTNICLDLLLLQAHARLSRFINFTDKFTRNCANQSQYALFCAERGYMSICKAFVLKIH